MRFITTPRFLKRNKKEWQSRTLKIVGLSSFDISKEDCIARIHTLHDFLENVPCKHGTLEESLYLGDVARAYAYYIAGAFAWKTGEFVLEEKDPYSDYFTVVSPLHEYYLNTGFIVNEECRTKKKLSIEFYEKIKTGQLPPSEPEKFLDIVSYFYPPQKPTLFFPLEKEKSNEINKIVMNSAILIKLLLDESGNLQNLTVEDGIQNLEKLILEDKADYKKTPKKVYLAALGALYGHLIKQGCGYEWGAAWFGEMCGDLTLYSSDKRYYMKPSNIVKKELLCSKNTCRLLSIYEQIKSNQLPSPEIEGVPEEIL